MPQHLVEHFYVQCHGGACSHDGGLVKLCEFVCIQCQIKQNHDTAPITVQQVDGVEYKARLPWYSREDCVNNLEIHCQKCGQGIIVRAKRVEKEEIEPLKLKIPSLREILDAQAATGEN